MFKPALARGEIQCIGATTLDEYRQYIEKDGALARRFQMVMVDPTTPEETIEILDNIKDKYEDHHHVNYTEDAIQACVKLSDRYISDRYLPDKAIDVIDEAAARITLHSPGRKRINEQDVQAVVHDVFRHRLGLTYEAQGEGVAPDAVTDMIVELVALT